MTATAKTDRAPRAGDLPLVWIVFALIGALKLVLLAIYGPIFTPDSGGYVAYAETMRASTAWLHDAGLSQGPAPVLAIRMVGYPALIVGAMAVFGSAWATVIVIGQIGLSLAASYAVYRLALELGLSQLIALFAIAAQMLSLSLTLDQCILTDSIFASLIMFAIVALTRGAVAGRALSYGQAACAGVLFMFAFLLRDAMQVLILALLPFVAVRTWLHGRKHRLRSSICCALVVVPVFAAAEGYKQWNVHRTGERFVTTVTQITVMHGLAKVAASDPGLFGGTTPLDRIGAQLFRVDPFGETTRANNELFSQGYRAPELARMAFAHYFRSWRERPETMLYLLKRNTSERAAKLTVRPLATVCETIEYATGDRQCFDYRELYRALPSGFTGLPWSAPVFFALQTIELTAAITIFALFLLAVPAVFIQRMIAAGGKLDNTTLIFGTFWAVYVAWYLAHAIVHIEDRYVAPVLPLSLLGGLVAWTQLRDWGRRRLAAVETTT